MMASEKLEEALRNLEERRKKGEISSLEFYRGLLDVLKLLDEELKKEELPETTVKRQIPLILSFIKSQIKELRSRGN